MEKEEQELVTLNDQQRQAAETLDENILLLAPAGTGKTNTLACRIANIIAQGRALPEEILCLTFTNKACRINRHVSPYVTTVPTSSARNFFPARLRRK